MEEEKAKKTKKLMRNRTEEEAEAARDTKCAANVLEGKIKEAAISDKRRRTEGKSAMNIEEEDSQYQGANKKLILADEQEAGWECTATKGGNTNLDIGNMLNTRKKARKARKQIRRENQGDKREREATKTKQRPTSNSSNHWGKSVFGLVPSYWSGEEKH